MPAPRPRVEKICRLHQTSALTEFTLLNSLPGSFGTTRSYNTTGSVVVLATFADKTQSLLRIDLP